MMGRRGKQETRFESAMLHEPKSLRCKGFGFFSAAVYPHRTHKRFRFHTHEKLLCAQFCVSYSVPMNFSILSAAF